MPRYYVAVILLIISHSTSAQVLEGFVADKENKNTIPGVSIFNEHSGITVASDSDGFYAIQAELGDTLLFRHLAYQTVKEVMTYSSGRKYEDILMLPLVYQLGNTIVTGLTKYQQDSMEKHLLYEHDLNKTIVPKPQYTGGIIGCSVVWAGSQIK